MAALQSFRWRANFTQHFFIVILFILISPLILCIFNEFMISMISDVVVDIRNMEFTEGGSAILYGTGTLCLLILDLW